MELETWNTVTKGTWKNKHPPSPPHKSNTTKIR